MMKHHNQKQLGEVYFVYISKSQFIIKVKSRQELEVEAMELALLKVEIVRVKATTTTWGLPAFL